ncbi:dolichyl-diphosphooligosaccharide--protein glycosyltransferase subunit 2 isoform X2 [Nematostella vectensis]|uniref:dolichyl-diphosphooligosaccharide--protein glycosyltransferase subunit 2 isoform X2 n=1 Tax=Nematostella vectensis TaxID=45351 RepID=UPI00138FCCBF|nr:dolichyl-diphosphooligosaccharide--protein glycosyltransferase subunit 2 isoform X2 [Nematostella vectensis]
MAARGVCLVLLALFGCSLAAKPASVLSVAEQARLRQTFQEAAPFRDLETAHYALKGLKFFKAPMPPNQNVCKFVEDNVDRSSILSVYHASSIIKVLGNCQLNLKDAEQMLADSIQEGAPTSTIFYAVSSLSNLGLKIDSAAVLKAVRAASSSDEDSVSSAIFAMNIAIQLPKGADINFIVDMVEDTVAQADEIDNTYLQFDGGLVPTAEVVTGAYKLGEYVKRTPTISEEQLVKFANYILSRKHVQEVKDCFFLLRSLNVLSNNEFHVPVVMQVYGSPLISNDNTVFKVRVTNVMDKALGKMTVTAVSAVDSEGTSILSNQNFKDGSEDYELDFMSFKPSPGIYTLTVNVKPQKADPRLIGTSGAELKVKVVTKVSIDQVELSIIDKEHSHVVKSLKADFPTSVDKVLEADFHQRVVMKFAIKSTSDGELMTPHQAFVRLTNKKTKQEIFFVPEPDSSKMFKFDLDVGATAKDSFGSLSGKYSMDLIVGDAVIENPFEWNVGSIALTFADEPAKSKKEKQKMYAPKPQIDHMFNKPEKRPPQVVSNAFTALIFLPLLVMIVVWMKLGVNVSNFQFSLGAILFHVGLGAIFVLYYLFWIKLNMFTTLQLLTVIGGLTFLGGNSLLSSIAARRAKR